MPRPSDLSSIYRRAKETDCSITGNYLIFGLKDSNGKTFAQTIKLDDQYPHFLKDHHSKPYTTLTINGEKKKFFLDSLELEWYQNESGIWQVGYAPLGENLEEEKKNDAIENDEPSQSEEDLAEDDLNSENDEKKEEPKPVLYQYNKEKAQFFSCSATSITVPVISTDEQKAATFAIILLRNTNAFYYNKDAKIAYAIVKIDGEEQAIQINSPDLRWLPKDKEKLSWYVSYGEPQAPLEMKEEQIIVEKQDKKNGEEEALISFDNVDEFFQKEKEKPFYTLTERENYLFKNNMVELYVSPPDNGEKEYFIIQPQKRTNEFVVDDHQVYAKVTVGDEKRPRKIPIDSPQLQWHFKEEDGKKIFWSCSTLPEYNTHYIPTKVTATDTGINVHLLLCNDYGEIDIAYTHTTITLHATSIQISENNNTFSIGGNSFPLESLLFKTTDGENFEPINSVFVKNTDKTNKLRERFKSGVVSFFKIKEEKKEKNVRLLTRWEHSQRQDNLLLKAIVLFQPLLVFFEPSHYFWNYLRTPYFLPSLALKNVDTIRSQWFNGENFSFSIPAQDGDDAAEYKTLEHYKIHYHQQTQSKLLGGYELPYFLGHTLWLLLSFIPLPFITAHKQRIALARDIKHIQYALTEKLEKSDDGNTPLALTGDKQQLNPWRFSANAPMKYQLTNGLYRLAMYSGALFFTTMAILTLITLAATIPLLPITMVGASFLFVASGAAALICFQEIFNPGSIITAISKALKTTIALQDVQSIKTLLLTSPLLFPFYASYKEIPGTEPGKRAITEHRNNANKNPLLDAYAQFVPTGDIQNTTLLRTVLNPFQLMQMTLTWITLSTCLITDATAKLFQATPLNNKVLGAVNAVFKTALYGLYSAVFLILNPPKQILAYVTSTIDKPITAAYTGVDTLNSAYTGNAYVLTECRENNETPHITLTHKKSVDNDLQLFKNHHSNPTNKEYLRIRIIQEFKKVSSKVNDFIAKVIDLPSI